MNFNPYGENGYVSADILAKLAQDDHYRDKEGIPLYYYLIAALATGNGIWLIADPARAAYIGNRWRYKNAEPSELGIWIARLSGIIILSLSVVLWLILIFA